MNAEETTIADTITSVFKPVTVVNSIHLFSSTKDSLHVKWEVDKSYLTHVTEYKLRYQAEGSTVVQYSQKVQNNIQEYNIKNLHEDTVYTVCVETSSNLPEIVKEKCLSASTSEDSLSVALGSTFGAFLALGIIVLFVFIAKWQHTRKLRKAKQANAINSYETIEQADPDQVETNSNLSLEVEGGTTIKYSETDNEGATTQQNGIMSPNGEISVIIAAPSLANCSECSDAISSSYIGGSSSRECCIFTDEDCCQGGGCDDPSCSSNLAIAQISPKSNGGKRRKHKLPKQRSMDARFLPYQQSLDLETNSRTKLPYQLSVDSYQPTRHQLRKQRSRESNASSSGTLHSHVSRDCCAECCPTNHTHKQRKNQCISPNHSQHMINAQNSTHKQNTTNSITPTKCSPQGSNISIDQGKDQCFNMHSHENTETSCEDNKLMKNKSSTENVNTNGFDNFQQNTGNSNSNTNNENAPVKVESYHQPDVRPKQPQTSTNKKSKLLQQNIPTNEESNQLNDNSRGFQKQDSEQINDSSSKATASTLDHTPLSLKPNLSCPNW